MKKETTAQSIITSAIFILHAMGRNMKRACGVFLLSLAVANGLQLPSRRKVLETSLLTPAYWAALQGNAHAAKGAAEYDLEFYMRDLVRGNKKEGNLAASKPPPAPPARTLGGPLLPLLLNDNCDSSCIPTKSILDIVGPSANVQEKMTGYRNGASRSFASRTPWNEDHVSNQYYFDLTTYALWRTAAELMPDYVDRSKFVRKIGKGIYSECVKNGSLKVATNRNDDKSLLTSSIPAMNEVLDLFVSSGFCKGYKIGDGTKSEIFDQYDDEDMADGASLNCLISVYEPATLSASLQITGEQSRFSPEFVATTLAAMWDAAGIKSSYETYFVDNEYRPNPKDFFPNEQLLQFALSKK